ncbi:MAG: DUF2141 domain-containing protein [Bacteroidales bacterium]|nr:DUF2141 domain-containing protein [Bacteroidales bacterium]
MKRLIISFLGVLLFSMNASAQNELSLEVKGVCKNSGIIKVSIFNNERSYKEKDIYKSFESKTYSDIISIPLTLPDGEYLFSIFQDSNENGVLDTRMLGIPKERVGFTNYDGKSIPGNFKKHKVLVNENTKRIIVNLYKI